MPLPKPELRQNSSGDYTPASLRDHFRHQISHMDAQDRVHYAYGVLLSLVQAPAKSWTAEQKRAIALGLELGKNEGVK